MNRVITVDFDDTLASTKTGAWGGTNLIPVTRIIDFVKQQNQSGATIHIVTFRSEKDKQEVIDFVKGYKLPVKSIVCTSSQNKIPFLKKLNSSLHIDDSVEVCTLCIMAGIECLLVDWGQENSNTTAKWIPKI